VATKDGSRMVPSFRVEAVDTTGAGDSFWGGFLAAFVESGLAPKEVSISRAAQFVRFGNAVASLCVRNRGAIPAMPERKDVEEVLAVAADQA
jgi:fructokinase